MNEVILDASALLALLFEETGWDSVSPVARGSRILSVNFSEVVARVIAEQGAASNVDRAVDSLEIQVVPFDRVLARMAAELRPATSFIGASLADRACLAFGLATRLPIISADRLWRKLDLGLDIRLIR